MHLEVDRSDLHRVRAVEHDRPDLGPGEARLRVDTFGLTSNNVTYAVFGDAMHYWGCFPGPEADGTRWGRIPVWGFGDVVESRVDGVTPGTRVYGYFPLADELVVRPGRLDAQGFSDTAPARSSVPSVYARYAVTTADRAYRPDREAQQQLLWPLMVTSFVVDDFLADHDLFGATTVVVSSASAKTAIAAAFLLAGRGGVEVVGLTSPANRSFVEELGCYATVATYDEVGDLAVAEACYVDVAGRPDVTAAVHRRFDGHLAHSMVVGDTHWDRTDVPEGPLPGPRPAFLFAPDQIAKRRAEWGRDGFEERVGEAWDRFVPWTDRWLRLRHASGPEAVTAAYLDLLEGRVDPRVGDVCTLVGGDR
jgi:NADPH:quinone reductase-like Zn-dependent oxidoreductase